MVDDRIYFSSLLDEHSSGGGHDWESHELPRLSSTEFERVVGAVYIGAGYDVERAGPTVEGGVDLLAESSGFLRSKLLVISLIPPGGTVSSATIDQLERARSINGAKRGVLVRPAPFDSAIRATTEEKDTIELVDGETLACRLTKYGVYPPW